MVTEDVETLFDMVLQKTITLVPTGADDDLYILHYARKHCCFIVSNDWYADHVSSHEERMGREMGRSMRLWVDTNRSSYVFVQPGGEFMLDPSSALSLAVCHVQNRAVTVFTSSSCCSAAGECEYEPGREHGQASHSSQNLRGLLIPAVLDELVKVRSRIQQLTSQYRELLRTGMAGDGVVSLPSIPPVDSLCASAINVLET